MTPTLDKYDYLAIANELIDTALGKAYYGNALYVAKQFNFLDDADQRVLDRWLAGTQSETAHIDLQSVANKIKVLGAIPMTRSQATPASSQIITLERMVSERDFQIIKLYEAGQAALAALEVHCSFATRDKPDAMDVGIAAIAALRAVGIKES